MINLETVNWRSDRITADYIARNRNELQAPETMKPADLGCAVTYCTSIDNPFSYEIMRRSGHLDKYREALAQKDRADIFNRACRYHGFWLG